MELSKSFAEVNSKAIMLQKLLDDANGKHKEMEKKYFNILEQNMILQSSLKGAPEGQNREGYKPLLPILNPLTHNYNSTENIPDSLQAERNAAGELVLIKGAYREGLRQSDDKCMPSTSARRGSSADGEEATANNNENSDIMDILSNFNYTEIENMRKENAELRAQSKTQRTKDGLEPESSISAKDMKALLEQIEAATGGRTSEHTSASVTEFSDDLRKMITEVRERTAKRQQVQQQSILSNIIERVENVLVPRSSAATSSTSKKWKWPGRQKLTQRNSTLTNKTPK